MNAPFSTFDLRILPPRAFCTESDEEYDAQIGEIQRLRGEIYVADGALKMDALSAEGRHLSDLDALCYHVCVSTRFNILAGCLRLRMHGINPSTDDLCIAPALDRIEGPHRNTIANAIFDLMSRARREGILFGEAGGWAVREDFRGAPDLMMIPLVGFAFFEHCGSALILAHATHRNYSARILKKVGASSLTSHQEPVSTVFDTYYNSAMEFIYFDSRKPAKRFAAAVQELKSKLTAVRHSTAINPQ